MVYLPADKGLIYMCVRPTLLFYRNTRIYRTYQSDFFMDKYVSTMDGKFAEIRIFALCQP